MDRKILYIMFLAIFIIINILIYIGLNSDGNILDAIIDTSKINAYAYIIGNELGIEDYRQSVAINIYTLVTQMISKSNNSYETFYEDTMIVRGIERYIDLDEAKKYVNYSENLDDIYKNLPIIDSDLDITTSDIRIPAVMEHDMSEPFMLIYHTHGTETYEPAVENNYHSGDENYSVLNIGDLLTKQLTDRGYNIIHDRDIFDYPDYNGAYGRSMTAIQKAKAKHPNIQIILDIHRDAAKEYNKNNHTVDINGNTVAKFTTVVGKANDNYNELMEFATYVKKISDALYPGLHRDIITKNYRFNQYNSDFYLLIEVGYNVNDIKETQNTVPYIVDILDIALNNMLISDISEYR